MKRMRKQVRTKDLRVIWECKCSNNAMKMHLMSSGKNLSVLHVYNSKLSKTSTVTPIIVLTTKIGI